MPEQWILLIQCDGCNREKRYEISPYTDEPEAAYREWRWGRGLRENEFYCQRCNTVRMIDEAKAEVDRLQDQLAQLNEEDHDD